MTMYSGDELYDDDVTSGPIPDEHLDTLAWVHETFDDPEYDEED